MASVVPYTVPNHLICILLEDCLGLGIQVTQIGEKSREDNRDE